MTRRTSRTLIGFLCFITIFGVAIYAIVHRGAHPNVASAKPPDPPATLLIATPPATQPVAEPAALPQKTTAVVPAPQPSNAKPNPDAKTVAFVETPTLDKGSISDGKSKIASGDLLAGRKILNDALLSGQLSPADAEAAKQAISDATKALFFPPSVLAMIPGRKRTTLPRAKC